MPFDDLLNAYLRSLTLTNPSIALDSATNAVYVRQQRNENPIVSVVSGGTMTATPLIASFVGPGVLAASSHSTEGLPNRIESVRIAIQDRVDTTKGVLVIFPQAGDELILGAAVEKAKARDPSLRIEVLIPPPTVGLAQHPRSTKRPGAGLPLLLKICGAVAAMGYDIEQVATVGKLVVKNLLSAGSILQNGWAENGEARMSANSDKFEELNLFNQNDLKKLEADSPWLISHVLRKMLHPKFKQEGFVHVNSNEVVLHVCGNESLSVLETGAITSEVVKQLEQDWNIRPVRVYQNTISRTTEVGWGGKNFNISILNVCNTDIGGPSMIQLLDAPAEALGWTACVQGASWEVKEHETPGDIPNVTKPSGLKHDPESLILAVAAGLAEVIHFVREQHWSSGFPVADHWANNDAAPDWNPNDCGENMWECARKALPALWPMPLPSDDIVISINDISSCIAPLTTDPVGTMCNIFLIGLTQSFHKQSDTTDEVNIGVWVYAIDHAFGLLKQYANDRADTKSPMNALEAFVKTLHSTGSLQKAAEAAREKSLSATDRGTRILCAFLSGLAKAASVDTGASPAGQSKQYKKTGCLTCLTRKMECDEEHPQCNQCIRASITCQGYRNRREPSTDKKASSDKVDKPSDLDEPDRSTNADEFDKPANPDGAAKPQEQAEPLPQQASPPKSPTTSPRPGIIASLGAALGLTGTETASDPTPEQELEQTRQIPATEALAGEVPEASRDAIVDELHIRHADFDAALESIRSRQTYPESSSKSEVPSLLDLVRQQIQSLGVSSDAKEGGEPAVSSQGEAQKVAGKDADEEEYELV